MYICSDGQAPENLKELLSKLFTKTNHKLHFPQNSQSCYTFPFIKEKRLVTGVLVLWTKTVKLELTTFSYCAVKTN